MTFAPTWSQRESLFSDGAGKDAPEKEQGQFLPSTSLVRTEAAVTPPSALVRKNQVPFFTLYRHILLLPAPAGRLGKSYSCRVLPSERMGTHTGCQVGGTGWGGWLLGSPGCCLPLVC